MMDDVRWDINLRVVAHKRNNVWVAWCPALRVVTQADTLPSVKTAIKEAVEGWFESCIERDVLQEALVELGFTLSDLSTNGSADISPQISDEALKLHKPFEYDKQERPDWEEEISIPLWPANQGRRKAGATI